MERRQKQRKYFYGRTQKEVLDKLNQAKIALAHGLELASERLTLETWLKQWLENQEPPASKPKAYAAYEYQIREHLIPELGRIVLTKLVPQDVRAFMKHKLATGLSPRTVRHLRATLRAALNMAVSDGILARNAASLTKPPRVPRRTPTVFDQAQALMFLEHAKGSRLEAAFTVAIAVAMREGEILGLRWPDIDFQASRITIWRTLQRVKLPGQTKSHLIVVEPKTAESHRTINLPAVAMASLAAHRLRQDQERILCGSKWRETGYVFTTPSELRSIRSACSRNSAGSWPRLSFRSSASMI